MGRVTRSTPGIHLLWLRGSVPSPTCPENSLPSARVIPMTISWQRRAHTGQISHALTASDFRRRVPRGREPLDALPHVSEIAGHGLELLRVERTGSRRGWRFRSAHRGMAEETLPGARDPLNHFDALWIQKRLHELGYYFGRVDGVWRASSRNALRDFKAINDHLDIG